MLVAGLCGRPAPSRLHTMFIILYFLLNCNYGLIQNLMGENEDIRANLREIRYELGDSRALRSPCTFAVVAFWGLCDGNWWVCRALRSPCTFAVVAFWGLCDGNWWVCRALRSPCTFAIAYFLLGGM